MTLKEFEQKLDNREFYGTTGIAGFKTAEIWASEANENRVNSCIWMWDCGLKLDYDGELITISSRFYPPHKHHASIGGYCGEISLYLIEEKITSQKVEAKTLKELKNKVEGIVNDWENKIKKQISQLFK